MTDKSPAWVVINRVVEDYEAAREHGAVELRAFLPDPSNPHFVQILVELARVEMELEWPERRPRVEDYLTRFPILSEHPALTEALASEEIRQRRLLGEAPEVEEYAQRLHIDSERLRCLLAPPEPVPEANGDLPSTAVIPGANNQKMPKNLPGVGSEFLGFRLEAELGMGAFSRVFLARQAELADRTVVLKLSACGGGEPQKLAQLQHTNIVPIYALYRHDDFEAICMPYFGACTLQHVIGRIETHTQLPQSALVLFDALAAGGRNAKIPRAMPLAPSVQIELEKRSYVDGAIWLVSGLARGLAHAHEQGILHLDLKPANILIADSGLPMLLDFNLAYSNGSRYSTHIGGTLPYMAPEHLKALQAKQFALDQRADIFSLGVVLYQLLTARLPFAAPRSATRSDLMQVAAQRSQPIVPPRRLNPQITPAVQAIVLRCLNHEPARRYHTAKELAEDLECQLAHQPLRHTREPSWREAAQKWTQRHPRIASGGSVACLAAVFLVLLAAFAIYLNQRLAVHEAEAKLRAFRDDLEQVRYLLHAPRSDSQQLDLGIKWCEEALKRINAAEPRADFAEFDAAEQPRLRQEIAEAHFLRVRAAVKRWSLNAGNFSKPVELPLWHEWTDRAIELSGDTVPQALLAQKELLRRLEISAGDVPVFTANYSTPPKSPQDLFLMASDHLANGELKKARTQLHELIRQQPDHGWGWIALGQCAEGLSQWEQAVACYSTAIALGPEYPWPYYLRGLAFLRGRKSAEACADFVHAAHKRPDWWEPQLSLAIAHQRLGDHQAALAALDRALQRGGPQARLLFIRARFQHVAGNKTAAADDLQRASAIKTSDEVAFVASGLARLPAGARAALADFDQALRINPGCESALQNKAHVLAEILDEPEAALAVMDRLLILCPEDARARAARAVLLARLQRREDAIAEAEKCLRLSDAPAVEYQLAGVFALTSQQLSADAEIALSLLQSALRRGWGHELLAGDRDLQPLRESPQFQRLLANKLLP